MKKKVWIDPPMGWMYGFPAIWDEEKETYIEMLIRYGYPEDQVEFALGYSRMWTVNEDDK